MDDHPLAQDSATYMLNGVSPPEGGFPMSTITGDIV